MKHNYSPKSSISSRNRSRAVLWAVSSSALCAVVVGVMSHSGVLSFGVLVLGSLGNLMVYRVLESPGRPSDSSLSGLTLSPCVLWFTGLPSSGKTTLSLLLKDRFESLGVKVEHLDGDAVRAVVPGIGFSRADRNDHIRRMGFLASRLEHQGISVIASFVSPFRESRDFARKLCGEFFEIYLSTDIDECTRRDVKGLYQESISGKRVGMTGVDDPYETPTDPELVLDTRTQTQEQCVQAIIHMLSSRGLLREQGSTRIGGNQDGPSLAARAR